MLLGLLWELGQSASAPLHLAGSMHALVGSLWGSKHADRQCKGCKQVSVTLHSLGLATSGALQYCC